MSEPGLDLHDWETRWQQLEELASDDPDGAIVLIDRLLGEMLAARGFQLDEPVTAEGEDPDIVRQFFAARDVARRASISEADPDDVATALEGYREIYDYLVSDRAPP